jgi:hydroxypyruvate isomerase
LKAGQTGHSPGGLPCEALRTNPKCQIAANDAFLLEHLDRVGYKRWIGGEYKPAAGTEAGLGWIHSLTR